VTDDPYYELEYRVRLKVPRNHDPIREFHALRDTTGHRIRPELTIGIDAFEVTDLEELY
jgi:hypothetical protein